MKALLALAFFVALPAWALEPIRVSPSVYYIRGDSGIPSQANRGHTSNAGFVVTKEGVVVFDALGTPVLMLLGPTDPRRHGPGDKLVRIRDTEVRASRTETTFNGAMTMDGGVGQSVW